MINQLHAHLARAAEHEIRRRAGAVASSRPIGGAETGFPATDVRLRLARPEDGSALDGLAAGLAALSEVLVADVDGRVVAAVALDGGDPVGSAADPSIHDLLALRARQIRRFGRSGLSARAARAAG